MGDYIRYLADDPDIRAISCFIESIKHAGEFKAACEYARDAGKPVVAVKIGGSEESRKAALAHTGSLAGSLQMLRRGGRDDRRRARRYARRDGRDGRVFHPCSAAEGTAPRRHDVFGRAEGADAGSRRAQRPLVPAAAAGDQCQGERKCSASAPRSAIRSTPASRRCRARRRISAASRCCSRTPISMC